YGKDALNRMVAAYADRLDTPGALKRSFHVEQAPFEAGYRKFIDKMVAGMDPGDPGPSASLAALESAVRRDSTNAVSQARLAGAYLEGGSLPQARAHAAAALRAQPRHPLAAYVMARVQVASGDTLGALKLLQGALYSDVLNPDAHAILARTSAESKRYDQAVEEYETALRLDARQPAWRLALAQACVEAKQVDRAREVLKELLDAEPQYPGARKLLDTLK